MLVSTNVLSDHDLHGLVTRIMTTVTPTASRNRSFLVNDVPDGLYFDADHHLVAAVLAGLFTTMTRYSSESCIRVSAKVCDNAVLLCVKDQHNTHAYTIASSLQQVQPVAEKIGGYVGVTSQRKNDATIVFRFPQLQVAA